MLQVFVKVGKILAMPLFWKYFFEELKKLRGK